MDPPTFLLLLLGSLALTQTQAGSHSLRYVHTAVSRPGAEPWFIGLSYVDDTAFERFESDSDDGNSRSEPLVQWMQEMDQRYMDQKTSMNRKIAQAFRENLWILPAHYNQNRTDGRGRFQFRALNPHKIKKSLGLCGCDLRPDGSVRQQAYDGEDFFSLNEELSWTYRDPTAWITLRRWNDTLENEDWKVCMMKHTCEHWLLTYLEKGKETLQQAAAPKTHLTHHPISEYETRLKCWALGFYPSDITLTWQLDGEDQTQNMELVETRPAGDGTFQKWAAVAVPSGEEQRYTCRVQHEGLPEPLILQWELASTSHVGIVIGMSVSVLGLLAVGAVMLGVGIHRKKSSENALKIKGYDWMFFTRQGGRSREKELGRRWARGGFRVRTAHAGRRGRRVHVRRKARSRAQEGAFTCPPCAPARPPVIASLLRVTRRRSAPSSARAGSPPTTSPPTASLCSF
ncbi:class I histocompatibility antigen, Gogo-B*0101 alpha chain-like [Rhynchocyon petersi]